MKKVLVIASHIDDEVLGCGGTIKKHTKAGDQVYVVFISSKDSKRFDEAIMNTRKAHAKKLQLCWEYRRFSSQTIPSSCWIPFRSLIS